MTDEYAQFAQGAEHPALAAFRDLVLTMQRHEADLAELNQQVKDKKAAIADIAEMQLPVLVESIGLGDELPLANGTKLVIKRNHGASPLVANRDKVWDWMEEHGHKHLVKRSMTASFAKDEGEEADRLKAIFRDNDIPFDETRKVESSTLSKFVRDAEGRGEEIPEDIFGVYRTAVAKITGKPKKHFEGE